MTIYLRVNGGLYGKLTISSLISIVDQLVDGLLETRHPYKPNVIKVEISTSNFQSIFYSQVINEVSPLHLIPGRENRSLPFLVRKSQHEEDFGILEPENEGSSNDQGDQYLQSGRI